MIRTRVAQVVAILAQARELDALAQNLRRDAAKLFRGLTPGERVAVAKESGISYKTLEILASQGKP